MIDLVLPAYGLNLWYAQKLVADVADDQMCAQPVSDRVMNHPAFVLGHLAWSCDVAAGLLGLQPAAAEWKEMFGMGAQPLADRSRYPAKGALLKALEEGHARVAAGLAKATPETLAQPAPERARARFPTVGNMLLGLMTSHEATHLGQLSAWRRAMGLPPVL